MLMECDEGDTGGRISRCFCLMLADGVVIEFISSVFDFGGGGWEQRMHFVVLVWW